uniref:Uncharacterized protein n=1 Tax=Ananas comosus var. bracteatus TaxID=296719 RepID=A0A6V7NW39_ANACO|nr:unnamed protein product [Ananas comosus var. bracteatus]
MRAKLQNRQTSGSEACWADFKPVDGPSGLDRSNCLANGLRSGDLSIRPARLPSSPTLDPVGPLSPFALPPFPPTATVYSQIALAADRTIAAGLKQACGGFQSAAHACFPEGDRRRGGCRDRNAALPRRPLEFRLNALASGSPH